LCINSDIEKQKAAIFYSQKKIMLRKILENILKIKVDLVSKNAIKPKYFEQIKNDLKYV